MILDRLINHSQYHALHPLFQSAFGFILKTDFSTLPLEKHKIIGDDLFVIFMQYETKPEVDCIMESHRRYIDIQYMVNGEENIGIVTLDQHVATTPYDEQKEAAFYKNEYESLFRLKQNHFAIFYPQDMHMTSIQISKPAHIKKAVFKVRV